MEKISRIKELIKELNKHRDAYYNDNESKISDYEYDTLYDELESLEKDTGIIFSNSPTQTVGYEIKSELKKAKHSHPMLSLDKTKSVDDLKKFIGNNDYVLSCKMDGLTILLTYDDGVLVKAETRGNGEVGEDVTHNAKVFENIPLTIPHKGHFEVEGEAIITYDDFEKINEKLTEENKYKNPRNLVSGSVRQLDSKIASQRHLKFVVWKVPTNVYNSFSDNLNYINKLGFTVVPYVATNDNEHLEWLIEDRKLCAKKLSYPIDGLVLTHDDIQYGESLGMTEHHPKHSVAYKFYDEEVVTTLKNIEWSMGKTGNLTPVAMFDPVDIDGTIVERASLHNVSILTQLDLQIGDEITVYKANMIIPQIRENLSAKNRKSSYIKIPSNCPVCGEPTEIKQNNDTEILICTNPYCKGKLLGRLSHFVSKKGMDIDGLSEETLSKFIDYGWLEKLSDVYSLYNRFFDLMTISGFGKKSVDKLAASLEKSRTVHLDRFITALSIPSIGSSQSKVLSKQFKTWDDFQSAGLGDYNFSNLEGFGDVLNNNIHTWFNTMYKEDAIEQMVECITFVQEDKESTDILSNKTFVITGNLNHYKNRDEIKDVIISNGGKVSGSVSKNVFALINNNINSTSYKNKKARELGVQIISEEDFIKMISN